MEVLIKPISYKQDAPGALSTAAYIIQILWNPCASRWSSNIS